MKQAGASSSSLHAPSLLSPLEWALNIGLAALLFNYTTTIVSILASLAICTFCAFCGLEDQNFHPLTYLTLGRSLCSLAAVAKRRTSLYGRVLPVLLGLAPNCENIKGGQVASVIHALKNALLSLLKCTHSGAGPVCLDHFLRLNLFLDYRER